jgi:hypothetical protein
MGAVLGLAKKKEKWLVLFSMHAPVALKKGLFKHIFI